MFIGRFNITDRFPPTKMYVHDFGAEVWGGMDKKDWAEQIKKAVIDSYYKGLENHPELTEGVDYIIAGAWGNNGKRVIDLAQGSDVTVNWPGNPDINIGFLVDEEFTRNGHICGDMAILIGEEESYRRGGPRVLDEFVNNYPTSDNYIRLFANGEPFNL